MLWWIVAFVLLGVAGLAVLGLLTLRLWRQVRALGRQVAVAGDRISAAGDALQRAAPRGPGA